MGQSLFACVGIILCHPAKLRPMSGEEENEGPLELLFIAE
jgi:hypothetical protein